MTLIRKPSLIRKETWIADYHAVIDTIRRRPFDWAGHDCATGLALKVVEAMTGQNPAGDWLGDYRDAASAYRHLRGLGFADLADLAAAFLPEYGHPSDAHIGDLAAIPVDTPFCHALGVINGERIFVLSETGLASVDRQTAVRAFKVG
ncbi:hypothetical protein NAC44_08165 [Allorhizobium sp. BGMRC 0089]|uniref:DUF6950 family protein n=1 Tax=Allorhizobium sonneratiae TaxID=2934936 RepID=UPI00203416BD|nr:hypothetical protein [Allorhizobium sonneratiae]MCM2292301.1 hypothetical protein [Allorhizobium sonneratiae]